MQALTGDPEMLAYVRRFGTIHPTQVGVQIGGHPRAPLYSILPMRPPPGPPPSGEARPSPGP
eukprot:10698640-Alexandrium_andersonii.AAC.1